MRTLGRRWGTEGGVIVLDERRRDGIHFEVQGNPFELFHHSTRNETLSMSAVLLERLRQSNGADDCAELARWCERVVFGYARLPSRR